MAKKRKVSSRFLNGRKSFDSKEEKLEPIKSFEDVADSEDEFHINRDKVLLENDGPEAKRRKKVEEEDALYELSDDEILEYPLSESEGDEEEITFDNTNDKASVAKSASDSEESEGEEVDGWGHSKRNYYNADVIETEADALEEEAEAKRLQQKKLQKLSEADFGFDEKDLLGEECEDEGHDVVTELLKEVEITPDMDKEERLRLLHTRYPEFNSLADEYLRLEPVFEQLQAEINGIQAPQCSRLMPASLVVLKYRTLAAYIGALAMYFAILTSTANSGDGSAALNPMELRDHSIMDSLLRCRQLWSKVKDLRARHSTSMVISTGETTNEINVSHVQEEIQAPISDIETVNKNQKQHAKDMVSAQASNSRVARIHAAEKDIADLASMLPKFKNPTKSGPTLSTSRGYESDSDFGEEATVDVRSATEKAARKKSLRFYTSQIAQKANRRADASRDAGGDADLPYRERLRDRQARLNAEAEKRGKKLDSYGRGKSLGINLDDNESGDDPMDAAAAEAVRGEEDRYYDLVTQASKSRKAEKMARYAAIAEARTAAPLSVVKDDEAVPEHGKRAIGYTIEKNKGLTPRRKKEVRNPRVKKRKKFEEKKKKLASMRPVFKGGEERGGYGGEKTGIKTGLIKSIKL